MCVIGQIKGSSFFTLIFLIMWLIQGLLYNQSHYKKRPPDPKALPFLWREPSLQAWCASVQNFSLQTRIYLSKLHNVLLPHINGGRLTRCFAASFFHSTVSLGLSIHLGYRGTYVAHIFSLLQSLFQHFPGHGHLFRLFPISGFYKESCKYTRSCSSSKFISKKLSGPLTLDRK